MERLIGLLGVGVMILMALALSTDRRRVPWRLVGVGVVVEFVLAAAVLRGPGVREAFDGLAWFVNKVISMSGAGIAFLFGQALPDKGGPWGFVFAVQVLPIVIFFSSLMSVLYYWGVMQRVVAGLAWALRKTMRVTGAEATCAAANIFLGQTEAPLTIRPLIPGMTRAQLMLVMVSGFASIAGSVLGAYVLMLGGESDESRTLFAKHLITASVMSAPAAFIMARILVPETQTPRPEDSRSLRSVSAEDHANVFDAAAGGATTGLHLALNIGAMLIAFVSLLALINWPLRELGEVEVVRAWLEARGVRGDLSLQVLLGWALAPVAWTMGAPWSDARALGSLLGEKLILTEFVAYLHLGEMRAAGAISARTAQIGTYALCGFANFASIAIQIGGLSVLAPEKRKDFARLALRAMLGGALATQMSASVAGVFIE